MIYESPSPDEDVNMEYQRPKTLEQVGIVHNSIINVEDLNQDFKLNISIIHVDQLINEKAEKEEEKQLNIDFLIIGNQDLKKNQSSSNLVSETAQDDDDDDDDLVIVQPSNKRKDDDSSDTKNFETKKRKVDDNVIDLTDD